VARSKVQRSKVLPTSLQSVKTAWANEQPVKVQFRNAASVCRLRVNRQSRKTQSVKTAPSSVVSDRSTRLKVTPVCS
jgi:hypothetical protein